MLSRTFALHSRALFRRRSAAPSRLANDVDRDAFSERHSSSDHGVTGTPRSAQFLAESLLCAVKD